MVVFLREFFFLTEAFLQAMVSEDVSLQGIASMDTRTKKETCVRPCGVLLIQTVFWSKTTFRNICKPFRKAKIGFKMKQVGVKKYILWYLFVRSRYLRKDYILPEVYHPILCLVATVLLCCTLFLGNACETATMRALLKFFSEKTACGNASL